MPEPRAVIDPPEGPVTILFTDVEGSTDMAAREGDERVQELLRDQEQLVRDRVRAHGGREIKSLGDGFMGLNTGEVTERGGDLFGAAVNIAARVAAKARGGQILISPTVREVVEGPVNLLDRGLFWLRGIPERVRLYEVDWTFGVSGRGCTCGETGIMTAGQRAACWRRRSQGTRRWGCLATSR